MIVFDLKCAGSGHIFEGWFASSEEFERQKADGLLLCPMCGDTHVEKAVMAPAVAAKTNRRDISEPSERQDAGGQDMVGGQGDVTGKAMAMHSGMDMAKAAKLMQALAQAQQEALTGSEWVGRRFADEARAMHYGEEDQRAIHGEVHPQEARALMEEGVEVAPLLFPVVPPKAQN
ncbi:MAG: DUF1178 family protein [Sphingobium sp.]